MTKKTDKNIVNKDMVKNHEVIHHSTAPRMEPQNKRAETRSKKQPNQIGKPKKQGK